MKKRLVIMTVGKTHSGKTTFARLLEQQLPDTVVIDRDNHAAFINLHYWSLLPEKGQNKLKSAITKTIIDYAVEETQRHLILCNSYRDQKDRLKMLHRFREKGLTSVLVNFDLPEEILHERIADSTRSLNIFRTAKSFEEVLQRQNAQAGVTCPKENEADYLFKILHPADIPLVIQRIIKLAE